MPFVNQKIQARCFYPFPYRHQILIELILLQGKSRLCFINISKIKDVQPKKQTPDKAQEPSAWILFDLIKKHSVPLHTKAVADIAVATQSFKPKLLPELNKVLFKFIHPHEFTCLQQTQRGSC